MESKSEPLQLPVKNIKDSDDESNSSHTTLPESGDEEIQSSPSPQIETSIKSFSFKCSHCPVKKSQEVNNWKPKVDDNKLKAVKKWSDKDSFKENTSWNSKTKKPLLRGMKTKVRKNKRQKEQS